MPDFFVILLYQLVLYGTIGSYIRDQGHRVQDIEKVKDLLVTEFHWLKFHFGTTQD